MSDIKKIRCFHCSLFRYLLFVSNQLTAAQVPDEIIQSLKTGDSKTFSEYFNQNVEMAVLENDNVYSKAQAQQIVNKFFSSNTPESFRLFTREGKKVTSM